MKLYDGGRAPNPRLFLAGKGVKVALEPVDLGALQHKSAGFARINPLQRVPVLLLDDGTGLITVDFMKPAKLDVPQECGNVRRWHGEVSARPSASA